LLVGWLVGWLDGWLVGLHLASLKKLIFFLTPTHNRIPIRLSPFA